MTIYVIIPLIPVCTLNKAIYVAIHMPSSYWSMVLIELNYTVIMHSFIKHADIDTKIACRSWDEGDLGTSLSLCDNTIINYVHSLSQSALDKLWIK